MNKDTYRELEEMAAELIKRGLLAPDKPLVDLGLSVLAFLNGIRGNQPRPASEA